MYVFIFIYIYVYTYVATVRGLLSQLGLIRFCDAKVVLGYC